MTEDKIRNLSGLLATFIFGLILGVGLGLGTPGLGLAFFGGIGAVGFFIDFLRSKP